jgi:hypothetical protein
MLIGNNIVFILGVDRLMHGGDVDLVIGEFVLAEVLEEVCVAGAVHVDECEGGVFILSVLVSGIGIWQRFSRDVPFWVGNEAILT